MRRWMPLAALCLSTATLYAEDYWCLNNHISLRADYLYWRRQEVRDLPLVKNLNNKTLLNTEDLEKRLGWESGVLGRLTLFGGECGSVEFLYTYMWPWEGTSTVKGNGNLQFPFHQPSQDIDYHLANLVQARYKTWFQNGEFTYWYHVTPQRVNYFSFSWDIGLRFIYLPEKFDMGFTRQTNFSTYSIDTYNTLYGVQLGAMLEMNPSRCWTWTFIIKGAGFLNVAKNELLIKDENNTIIYRDYTKRTWTDSYLIEGFGQLAYHFNRFFSVHFAYQGFLLTGVALAPDQRDVSRRDRRKINVKGQIVVDGLQAGLDFGF